MKKRKALTGIKEEKESKKTVPAAKIFLGVFGLATAGGAIYLLYEKLKSSNPNITINNINPLSPIKNAANVIHKKSRNDSFPLKVGSKGERVRELQTALNKLVSGGMNSYGGIDGDFGTGTENALRKAGLPAVIDEVTFNSIMGKSGNDELKIIFNPSEIAHDLFYAARSMNLAEVINQLRKIKTTKEYSDVSAPYQKLGIIKRTIVTDLLDFVFKDNNAAKQQIRSEFLRMGLKNDPASAKWSLSGFRLFKDLITIKDTFVQDTMKNKIPVRAGTILGDEMESSNGMTYFKALDSSIGAVPSKDVKYVE